LTMASRIVLDTGPLGKISHPRPNREIADWLERLLREGALIYIPEIADYEVRRELIRAGLQESVNRRPPKRVQDRYNLGVPRVFLRAFGLPTVPHGQRVSHPMLACHA